MKALKSHGHSPERGTAKQQIKAHCGQLRADEWPASLRPAGLGWDGCTRARGKSPKNERAGMCALGPGARATCHSSTGGNPKTTCDLKPICWAEGLLSLPVTLSGPTRGGKSILAQKSPGCSTAARLSNFLQRRSRWPMRPRLTESCLRLVHWLIIVCLLVWLTSRLGCKGVAAKSRAS